MKILSLKIILPIVMIITLISAAVAYPDVTHRYTAEALLRDSNLNQNEKIWSRWNYVLIAFSFGLASNEINSLSCAVHKYKKTNNKTRQSCQLSNSVTVALIKQLEKKLVDLFYNVVSIWLVLLSVATFLIYFNSNQSVDHTVKSIKHRISY